MGEISSEEKILAGFSHLMIVFGLYGTAAAIVIWIVKRDKSEFIKKSVKQAIAYQIVVLVALKLMGLFWGNSISMALTAQKTALISLVGIVWSVAGLTLLLYGVVGAVSAFKGKSFKYVVIGDFIDKVLN